MQDEVSRAVRLELRTRVLDEFCQRFGGKPSFFARAPGRVNLIGDHTDYNDGFVLPMAIDREICIAVRARDDRRVSVYSIDFDQDAAFALDGGSPRQGDGSWVEYLRGVAWALDDAGRPTSGWEGVVAGNIPVGAGLSSSAALELATARVFSAVNGVVWQPVSMANLNTFRGFKSLVFVGGSGNNVYAIDYDFGTLFWKTHFNYSTGVPEYAGSPQCPGGMTSELLRRGFRVTAGFFGVPALRDVVEATFEARESELDALTRKRARHVVTENARTVEASALLEQGDVRRFGALMDESHTSLRDDFEVSRPELDTMVAIARRQKACHGARMTGAGFGGCAVALVARAGADAFTGAVFEEYEKMVGIRPTVYVCEPSAGASVEELEPNATV